MSNIIVPAMMPSDDVIVISEWLVADGDAVSQGQIIVVCETSKAQEELCAPSSGYLSIHQPPGAVVQAGDHIGAVCESRNQVNPTPNRDDKALKVAPNSQPLLSTAAQRLVDTHQISMSSVRELGKLLVRESDVRSLIRASSQEVPVSLSRNQKAVAQVVTESIKIPSAYVATDVDCTGYQRFLAELRKAEGARVGMVEIVARSIGNCRERFEEFFAVPVDTERGVCIGVTIDMGKGLFIPVLEDVINRSYAQLSERLNRFRSSAFRAQFLASELRGAQITLSINSFLGMTFGIPLIYPGQFAIVSMGSIQEGIRRGVNNEIEDYSHFVVGMSYDHRNANGLAAAKFIGEIRRKIEEEIRENSQ